MLSLQSPHNSHKPELLQQNISPSFRNKRIPSAHESYSYSSNHNLKICKIDSPSKLSQKLKRRKSQYINSSSSYLDKNDLIPQKKKSAKSITQIHTQVNQSSNAILNVNGSIGANTPSSVANNNILMYPQNIINEMNCLKNEYKQLKSAYQELIEEKINNSEKMAQIKNENRKLEAQLEIALQKLNSSNTPTSHQNNNINYNNNPSINSSNPHSQHSNKPTLTTSASLESIQSSQIEFLRTENQKLKEKVSFNEMELERIKKECYKLLEAEKFKSKKLEQSLKEKDDIMKIFTHQKPGQNHEYSSCVNNFVDLGNKPLIDITQSLSSKNINNFKILSSQLGKNVCGTPKMASQGIINRAQQNIGHPLNNPAEESLFISQDKSFIDQTYNNQSQFISISLTSVMEESVCRLHQSIESKSLPKPQPKLSSKAQSKTKQMIDQTHFHLTESTQTVMPHLMKQPSKRQKLSSRQNQQTSMPEPNHNMKKLRKQVHSKLQINLNHFDNNRKQSFLNLKTPISTGDKKLMGKNKNSKSKKKDEDKENNQNYYHGKDVTDLNVGKGAKKKDKNHSLTHK